MAIRGHIWKWEFSAFRSIKGQIGADGSLPLFFQAAVVTAQHAKGLEIIIQNSGEQNEFYIAYGDCGRTCDVRPDQKLTVRLPHRPIAGKPELLTIISQVRPARDAQPATLLDLRLITNDG